jgi:site-specific recombinase XerD
MTDLVPIPPAPLTTDQTLRDRATQFQVESVAANTRRAYSGDWRRFTAWCAAQGRDSLPATPDTALLYLTHLADQGKKVATIERAAAAIATAHRTAGHTAPTEDAQVRRVMRGIRRTLKVAPTQKAAAVTSVLRQLIDAQPNTLVGLRNRALLLIGFAGAFRRSELVALDVADVRFVHEGLEITVRQSKTDPEGKGHMKGLPYGSHPETCPVRVLRAWLDAAGITAGPLLRSFDARRQLQTQRLRDYEVAKIIKRSARKAGIDAAAFSGHSLRIGFVTSAYAAGVPEDAIMAQTGHRSIPTVRRYKRRATLFQRNAAAQVGL